MSKTDFPESYPHGAKLSDREALLQQAGYNRIISEKFRKISEIVGTQTDCQCQGEPDCKWCQIRKILES